MESKKTELFKKYKRTQIAELRPVTEDDIHIYRDFGRIAVDVSNIKNPISVSISDEDLLNRSPKLGDMIGRNPKNHKDQWLIAEQYFKDNFEDIGAESLYSKMLNMLARHVGILKDIQMEDSGDNDYIKYLITETEQLINKATKS